MAKGLGDLRASHFQTPEVLLTISDPLPLFSATKKQEFPRIRDKQNIKDLQNK